MTQIMRKKEGIFCSEFFFEKLFSDSINNFMQIKSYWGFIKMYGNNQPEFK